MEKKNGVWHISENWFLNYIWMDNFLGIFCGLFGPNFAKEIPLFLNRIEPRDCKNKCAVVWGSLLGVFLTLTAFPLLVLANFWVFCAGCILLLVLTIVGAFFGFYLCWKSGDGERPFYPYKYFGEKKIPIALWEVCLFAGGVYLLIKYVEKFSDFVVSATTATVIAGCGLIQNQLFLTIFGAVLFVLAVICVLFYTDVGKIFREYLKDLKEKKCSLVVIVRKEKHEEK